MLGTLRSMILFVLTCLVIGGGFGCAGPPQRPTEEAIAVTTAPPVVEGSAFDQVAWLLSITDAAMVTEGEVLPHFHTSFTDAATIVGTQAVVAMVAQQSPARLDRFLPESTPTRAIAALVHEDRWYSLRVATDAEEGSIIGLSFAESPQLNPNWSWDLFGESVQTLAEQVNYLAAEVVEGECRPIQSLNADQSLGIGSSFKLWILTELAAEIIAGERAWEDTLAIREEWKSTPTGQMQNLPVGEEHTLRYFAEQMISISDNTATDHLLHTLGRERVERAVERTGHHDPSELAPFLATFELFTLKLLQSPEQRRSYLNMPTEERRRYVEEELTWDRSAGLFAGMLWTSPRDLDLEWYASASDLCNVMVHLQEQSATEAGAPVGTVLSINPGFPLDSETWPYIGYKGGSEPGVFNFTWLLRRSDDRWFVFSAGLNDSRQAIDLDPVVIVIYAGLSLLEGE